MCHLFYLPTASSWGGNICLKIMNKGVWSGPTLLLAPAQGVVAQRTGVDAHTLPRELTSPVHIIHGTGIRGSYAPSHLLADTTVIYMHSTKLAASTKSHDKVTFHLHKGKEKCKLLSTPQVTITCFQRP